MQPDVAYEQPETTGAILRKTEAIRQLIHMANTKDCADLGDTAKAELAAIDEASRADKARIAELEAALRLVAKVRLPDSMPGLRDIIESVLAHTSGMVAVERERLREIEWCIRHDTCSRPTDCRLRRRLIAGRDHEEAKRE